MPPSLIITIVITRSQGQVRGAARPLIWNLDRVGRRLRLVWAGGYAGGTGTSGQGGLTSSRGTQ